MFHNMLLQIDNNNNQSKIKALLIIKIFLGLYMRSLFKSGHPVDWKCIDERSAFKIRQRLPLAISINTYLLLNEVFWPPSS
jgi:hypothetical protein